MKSQKARTYEIDGKSYQFNRFAFVDAVKRVTGRKDSEGKRIGITQGSLFEEIADRLFRTPEAIKHWYFGNNSPVDLKCIETCADVLGIDFMNLLTPTDDTMEDSKMNDKEVSLIENVFETCVTSVHSFIDNKAQKSDCSDERKSIISEANEKYQSILSQAHLMVDAHSLFVSSKVKYRLHRIINDMMEFQWNSYDRWVSVAEETREDGHSVDVLVDLEMISDISSWTTREDALSSYGIFFLDEEKELAAKLGYSYTDIPEEYYEDCDYINHGICRDKSGNKLPLDNFHILDTDFEVTATIFVKDSVTRLLKLVFTKSFPELRFPD